MSEIFAGMIEYQKALITSDWVQAIEELTAQIADTKTIVLVRGESGAGKECIARLIHGASARSQHAFIKVNAALPEDRLAPELCGHEREAFAGVFRRKLGRLEFAHHGTLFLDNIELFPPALQPALLRVVQEGQFFRIGGREVIRVDVRLIAATTQSLEVTASRDRFSEDSQGLRVVDLQIPPLRDRRDDIPALASFFSSRFTEQYHRPTELSPEILALFSEYSWPRNIRELEEFVRRLVVTGDPCPVQEEIRSHLRLARPGPGTLLSA
jgi:DNA-binding NtrC family response regulator